LHIKPRAILLTLALFLALETLCGAAARLLPVTAVKLDAITYPAGWNLIGGPGGSHVLGASGSLYTLQPGDADYETVSVESPLHGGWGYWAYFPAGGSLDTSGGADPESFAMVAAPGQYTMVGNPSSSRAAPVNSALYIVYTLAPGVGYQPAQALLPGQGGWITQVAAGDLIVPSPMGQVTATPGLQPPPQATPSAVASPIAAPAPPTPTPAPAPCVSGSCAFSGEAKGTLTLPALGGFSITPTITFQITVTQGQVSGQGQYMESFTMAVPQCSTGTASGQVTVTGSLSGTMLQLTFKNGPLQRLQFCAGTTSPVLGPFGTLSILDLYQVVNVEARDGGTGTALLIPAEGGRAMGSLTVTLHQSGGQ